VPSNYLAKILQLLAREGVLERQKGFGVGFRIARPLGKINLLAIVDPLENISKFKRCVLGQRECSDEVACPLHDAWKRISNEYLGALERTTLQDVADFRQYRFEPLGGGDMATLAAARAARSEEQG
jgi:Rrf2 family protein